jgi:ribose/xylose/arabinose/galactoside ABC-type transport system permease subunit
MGPPAPMYAPVVPGPATPADRAAAGAPGGPERDRLAVHLIWEAFLGLVAIVLVGVLLATEPGQAMTNVLRQAGAVGLMAAGLSLSLRTGTPNLAVGALAAFSGGLGAHLAAESGWSVAVAMTAGVAATVGIGVLLGVLTGALSVPGWAVTLGAATILEAGLIGLSDGRATFARISGEYPTGTWFGLFLFVSIGGGVLWLIPGLRRRLGAVRRPGEPGRWAGIWPGIGALVGLTGSSLLAGLGGVAQLSLVRIADPAAGQFFLFLALAAVLLGGTSVFGRRAGVTGTVSAVLIILIVRMMFLIHAVPGWETNLFVGLMVVLGLCVSRGLESVTNALNAPRRPPILPVPAGPGVLAPAPPPPPAAT